MAKKKLNLRWIIIVAVAIVLGIGAVVLSQMLPSDPAPFIQAAEQAELAGELDKAAENYARAFNADRDRGQRIQWGIRAGDGYWMLGQESKAASYYAGVLRFYDDCVPAQERLVSLLYWQASLFNNVSAWVTARDKADLLVQMAPQRPLGHRVAGLARFHIGQADHRLAALSNFEQLRRVDANDPAGYFYPAIILSQKQDRVDPKGPKYDPKAADALMASMPTKVEAAVADRFKLYQALYMLPQTPEVKDLSPEQVKTALQAHVDKVRKLVGEINDFSAMTRSEQTQLAELAQRLGDPDKAETIYKLWINDRVSLLAELGEPPARQPLVDKLLADNRNSLLAQVRLAQLYLRSARLDEVEQCIVRGLALPTLDKGIQGELHASQQSELMLLRAKRLLAVADASHRRNDYQAVNDALSAAAGAFSRLQSMPEFQRIAGKVAFNLDQLGVAQSRLEQALRLYDNLDPKLVANDRAETSVYLIEVYRQLKQYGTARGLLDRLMQGDPRIRNMPQVRLVNARSYVDVRDYARAIRLADEMIADPEFAGAPDLLAQAIKLKAECLRQSGDLAGAVKVMALLPGAAGSAEQLYREGLLASSQQKDDQAMAKFREALAKDKSFWPAASGVAAMYLKKKQKPQAEQAIRDFLAANPDHDSAKLALVDLQEGREKMLEQRAELIKENETETQRELRLAEQARRERDREKAFAHLANLEKMVDDSSRNAIQVVGFNVALDFGDWNRARSYLKQLEASDADGIGGLSYRARMLHSEGSQLINEARRLRQASKFDEAARSQQDGQTRLGEAIQLYYQVLQRRQADSQSRRLLAHALAQSGRGSANDVIELLRQSIKDNPLDADSWRELVRTLHTNGRQKEAWLEADRGLAQIGSDGYLEQVRLERLDVQRPESAIAQREKMAKAQPTNWRNGLALAELYMRQGQREQAQPLIDRAIKDASDAERYEVLLLTSDMYRRFSQPTKGEQVLRDALKDNADHPLLLVAMGDYIKRLGQVERFEEAEGYYKKSLGINPDPATYLVMAEFYRLWNKQDQCIEAMRMCRKTADQAHDRITAQLIGYLIEFGRLDEAAQAIGEYRQSWPGNPAGSLLQAGLLTRQGKFREALTELNELNRKHPDLAVVYARKAEVLHRIDPTGNLPSAISNMQRALALDRDLEGEPELRLADFYLQNNEAQMAVRTYRDRLERDPNHLLARVRLIRVLSSMQRTLEVDNELEQALKMFPDLPVFHQEAGHIDMQRRQFAQAEAHYRDAFKLAPRSEDSALMVAVALANQKRWSSIIEESQGWLTAIGDTPKIRLERVRAYQELGQSDNMLAEMGKAVDAAKGAPDVLLPLAVRLRDTVSAQVAERWVDEFVAKQNNSLDARLMRAQFLSLSKKLNSALADLNALLKEHPAGQEAAKIHFNMAIMQQQADQLDQAASHFQAVISLVGDQASPVVLNNYAYLLADKMNRAGEAVGFAEKAAARTNRDPNVLDTLGWCYIKAGQVQKGVDVLNEALQRERLPVIYYHLALGYQTLNQSDNAKQMARTAIELAKTRKDAATQEQAETLLARLSK